MKKLAEVFLKKLLDALIKYFETVINEDIDGDGKIGS